MLCAVAVPCAAHMMSMSSGDVKLSGARLDYTLTMPLFEVAHVRNAGESLLNHVQFHGARLVSHECHTEPSRDSYVCRATYEYAVQPDAVEVTCTLPDVTVPNHIHLLRAMRDGKSDRAVFDSAFTHAVIRFRPPTPGEVAAGEIAKGAGFVFTSPVFLFLLVTLGLACTSYWSAAALSLSFLAGQIAGAWVPWSFAPRLIECAAALGVAYLAVEILFLSSSRARLAAAAALGIVPGLALAQFASQSESGLGFTLVGSCLITAVVAVLASIVSLRLPVVRRPAAALACAAGLGWFAIVLSR